MNRRPISPAVFLLLLIAASAGSSCGLPPGQSPGSDDGSPRLKGDLVLGTQCPYGMVAPGQPGRLSLKGCAGVLDEVELLPSSALYFSGDCAQKTLAVRTADLRLDSLWQVLPDDSFNLWISSVPLLLGRAGGSACSVGADLHISGRLNCRDQDRMTIEFDRFSLEELGKCGLPASCRLEARPVLRQCL